MKAVVWFKRDLRIRDNPALYHACKTATEGVIAYYFVSPKSWQQHHDSPKKISFWLDNVCDLQQQLLALKVHLHVFKVTSQQKIETLLLKHCQDNKIDALFYNKELEINEHHQEVAVATTLAQHKIKIYSYDEACILTPGSVNKDDGNPYVVFTPFKKRWLQVIRETNLGTLGKPKAQKQWLGESADLSQLSTNDYADYDKELWPAGEQAALTRLVDFSHQSLTQYDTGRDRPDMSGTSRLSPYLTAGVISARQCYKAAINQQRTDGQQIWISELIWRDFYKHIMVAFPTVMKHHAFQTKTESLQWSQNQSHFKAWCKGQTGIPIVDAGMRQLNSIGWMHNRCRMICAMFLTKNLFIDWRWGERYFMEQLLDGDLAANNGGWQWSASTGTDAAPYFRIFNPYRQSERFDPEGKFIRQYCPELSSLSNKHIHQPPANIDDYPNPILDVGKSRKQAIAAFKALSN